MEWISSGTWNLGLPEKQRLESMYEACKGTGVLDVGCRDATFSLTLAHERPDVRVVAFDTDASAIAWANAKADELGIKNFIAYQINIFDSFGPVTLGTFDTVVVAEVLEHLPPQRLDEAWAMVRQYAKKDGRIIVTLPANSHVSDPGHLQVFHREYILRQFPNLHWLKWCPFLWIGFYLDEKESGSQ